MTLRAVAGDVHVVHDRDAVVTGVGMTQHATVVVRGRQRDVIARQVRGTLEARGVEVAGRAFPRDHVRRAVGLERRAHFGDWSISSTGYSFAIEG